MPTLAIRLRQAHEVDLIRKCAPNILARISGVRKLCRFLGFGLLGVSTTDRVEVLVEPGPWRSRRDPKRRSRLVNEHRRRLGDPVLGGTTKSPIMTAYRQQALACAASLSDGPRRT